MEQFLAIAVFIATYIFIGVEKAGIPRHIAALLGAGFMVVTGVLDLGEAMDFVSWDTMGLLLGMFVFVALLSKAGFFEYIAMAVAEKVKFKASPLFIVIPMTAGLLATVIDSITVLLFFTVLVFHLCSALEIDPIPMVIASVCAANTGGAATLVGDPPNVILGTTLGFDFLDFVLNTGPIALLAMATIVLYIYYRNAKALKKHAMVTAEDLRARGLSKAIKEPVLMKKTLVGLTLAVALLIAHKWVDGASGLHITSASAALGPALLTLVWVGEWGRHTLHEIDIESLLFFVGLFVIVGGLEKTGVISEIAMAITSIPGAGGVLLLVLMLWFGAIVSGVVDNVPLALAMAYVIKSISAINPAIPLPLMVWATSLGVDIGGNFTPVGASANVVAYSTMERLGKTIGWRRWIAEAMVPTLLALAACTVGIVVKYALR
ncbi:MAG TPA: hypothetical protein GX507_00565 [Clostridia bacterium]|nr:hypothetical protein [Clostridia bacterium]